MGGRLRNFYWPDLSAPEAAERSLKNAALVAYIVAGVTALVSSLALFNVTNLISPWFMLAAVVFAVIGYFISRRSRAAAVVGLVLYALGAIVNVIGSGGLGIAVALFFTIYLLNGVRASYHLAHPRQRSAADDPAALDGLQSLFDAGVIDAEQFDRRKKEISGSSPYE